MAVQVAQLQTSEDLYDLILTELETQTGIPKAKLGAIVQAIAKGTAEETDELYYQLYNATLLTYIETSTGADLERMAYDYGLTRRPATSSTGVCRFSGTPSATIPLGTLVSKPATDTTDELIYQTVRLGTIDAFGDADVYVEAQTPGTTYNVGGSTITNLKDTVDGISSVSNPSSVTGATDEESDADLRERLKRRIDALSAGTVPSVLHGAIDWQQQQATLQAAVEDDQTWFPVNEDLTKLPFPGQTPTYLLIGGVEVVYYGDIDTKQYPHKFQGIRRAQKSTSAVTHEAGASIEEYIPAGRGKTVKSAVVLETLGFADVWIDDGTSSGPDALLVELVQKRLQGSVSNRDPGYRGAAITLTCHSRVGQTVDVVATVKINGNYDLTEKDTEITSAVETFIDALKVGEPVIAYQLAEVILGVEGVVNIQSLSLNGVAFTGTSFADVVTPDNTVTRTGANAITTTY